MSKQSLKIMFLAAEAEPFIKIGGLGDIAGTLPREIKSLSNSADSQGYDMDIRLIIPFHGAIQRQDLPFHSVSSFSVPTSNGEIPAQALGVTIKNLPVYFISGPPIPPDAPVYSQNTAEDGEKFTFFSLAALELAKSLDWQPDILHANDWHTTPAIIYLKTKQDTFFSKTAAVLGLHNLPFMGENAGQALENFNLTPAHTLPLPWWAQNLPLPLGLFYADHIVTVSPSYAKEILTPEFGAGLEEFLSSRKYKISGILNGIDMILWNPSSDKTIPAKFSLANIEQRQKNKASLIKEFQLNPDPEIPLLTIVTRFDYQKGIDLLPVGLKLVEKEKWQMIILGTGNSELEAQIRGLENSYPGRLHAAIRFDANLSHRLYAGSDAIVIPSRYEPCGLTQMIAMRYGCVPIARSTGGLHDTIHDHSAKAKTGFLFSHANSKDLSAALRRAINCFNMNEIWQQLQINGMSQDFSWEKSARQYLNLYRSLIKK